MRILIVPHYFLPHIGGLEGVAKKQAESLAEAGNDVTVITCRPPGGAPLHDTGKGYRIKRLRALAFLNKGGVTFPLCSPFSLFTFIKAARNSDAVHIHDVFYMTSHLAGLAAIITGKPLFLTQHVAMVDHPKWLVMAMQKFMYGTWGRLLFARAKKIVCYNTNVKDCLLQYGVPEHKIALQHNGIDVDYFSPAAKGEKRQLRKKYNLPVDKPIALFVGRLVPKKGYDIVFDTHGPSHLTIIAGTGDAPDYMRNHPDVLFTGAANADTVRDYYRLSDVFVFPAVGEIWTLVMQEAMASGLPVITTNDPAYQKYNVDGKLFAFVGRSSQEISRRLHEIVDSPELRVQMGAYSRKLALERFSWRANYKTEMAIYEQEPIK